MRLQLANVTVSQSDATTHSKPVGAPQVTVS